MIALLRYQAALLLRSQRWLPPVLLYAAVLGIGVQTDQPVLDSLGFTAAAVLPVAAWIVRICATNEPPAARSCVGAAVGPARAHLACLLVAFGAAALLGVVVTLVVAVISDPASTDHRTPIPVVPAGGAGLLATLACALLGTAVGALTTRPLLRSTGRAVPAMLITAVLALVVTGSPARTAVTALVTGSQDGVVPAPVLPLFIAGATAAAAIAAACALTTRRD
ncbi:ABC transporter [Streptomyces sp. NBC_00878]|uniref:ABC transporter n=1 Tax=Streptomyces sp. NBC_00878 TaxID=2975854 RepID=UPI00225A9C07|nr:ABC transporter [Streptomyces sp. NBC_00878]MCX4904687.1 ABC transporter [Streptomyces sp. NBC_00878]